QDLALTCPFAVGPAVVDACVAHKGVAHFLFHPAHIKKPGVAEAITNIIDYGRARGLEWWTSAQINDWERARRAVRIETAALDTPNEHRGHNPGRACFDVVGDGPSLDVTLAFALGVGAGANVSIRAESAAAATPNEPVPLTVRTLRYAGQALFAVDLSLSERVRLTLEW
ncbi:MAG TPA: hypothetical protein VFK80_00350, partial [Limnochordia bacterium]|nr:hypothetical protein [Limnochordia bacterium]